MIWQPLLALTLGSALAQTWPREQDIFRDPAVIVSELRQASRAAAADGLKPFKPRPVVPVGPATVETLLGSADRWPARLVRAGVLMTVEDFDRGDFGPGWWRAVSALNAALKDSPGLLEKIHELRIRRGRREPFIDRAEDGAATLVLSFDFEHAI